MRKLFFYVLLAGLAVLVTAVVVFHYAMGLDWLDASYFSLTIMTTIGFGDFSLKDTAPAIKIFGMFLMLVGTASFASIFGIVTDFLLKARIEEILGVRRRKMKDHIILCGLGTVGFRVFQWLHKLNEPVVVVEKSDDGKFVNTVKAMKIPVVIGDLSVPETLDRVNISQARCIIAATDKDLVNIEAALNARSRNEEIRVVMRVFDQNLAAKLQDGMAIDVALSTSALAAPAIAMAAVDPSVVGSFFVGDDLVLNIELIVQEGAALASMTSKELVQLGDYAILAHEAVAAKKPTLIPSAEIVFAPGDRLVIAAAHKATPRLHELNRVQN